MADKYYAWTNIETIDDKGKSSTFKVGDEVTASQLGVDEEEFDEYVKNGAIRTIPHPDMGGFSGSPVEYAKAQVAAMSTEDGYFEHQFGRVEAPTEEEVAAVEADAPVS